VKDKRSRDWGLGVTGEGPGVFDYEFMVEDQGLGVRN
jgi:hypothetical protein